MQLLSWQGGAPDKHIIFRKPMFVSKFAVIFVNFLKQDYPTYWSNAFQELFGLIYQEGAPAEYRMQIISKFIFGSGLFIYFWSIEYVIQVLLTLNQDMVERGEHKAQVSQEISNRVKDGVRAHAI